MAYKNSLISVILFLLVISFFSCKGRPGTDEKHGLAIQSNTRDSTENLRLIFYNMYLPPQMSRIFERVGANYDPAILNQPDNFGRYQGRHKIALNLGVFGVDLNYTRIFDQTALTSKYFSTIQLMTSKLGIPSEYYERILENLEQYYKNKDTIIKVAGELYERTDNYLKEKKHNADAALIVTGGWIEALYISTQILKTDPDNVEMSDRIAEQKYSLNSLISLLSNFQEDIDVAGDILMLKLLKKSFDRYEIYYDQDDFKLDTVNKLISTSNYHTGITTEILGEIGDIVAEIRAQMIN